MTRIAASTCLVLLFAAAPVAAQTLPRLTFSVNAGYQPSTTDFDDRFTFTIDQDTEQGTTDITYPIESAVMFDGGGAVRFWRRLAAGVGVSRYTHEGVGRTRSRVPHPFFFDRHREVTGDATGLSRDETGIHMQLQYLMPLRPNLLLTLGAGPSRLSVNQEMITIVHFNDEFPYESPTLARPETRRFSGNAIGFNAGADVQWMFARRLGLGGLVRFTRADVDLDGLEGRALTVDAGGLHASFGFRVGF